ncbi:MAG: DEAD/DEAH box helicase [Hyphomonas sp.]
MTAQHNLPSALAEALANKGYENLTQVQTAVLEPSLAGRDLLVSAQTGSGKTVAFGLAMAGDLLGDAERLPQADTPLALIVAPTRELAVQVARELTWLYGPAGARLATCVGGMDMRDERKALARGAHIVVGTPGRLSDHIKRGSLDTAGIRVVVLDEADEMLDMGFREELEHILEGTPETRRTLMFSATVPKGIANLAARYQKDAERVRTEAENRQHIDIEYRALLVAPGDEENAIVNIVRHSDSEGALVFCTTRAAVNKLMSRMGNRGFPVVALSGELSQKERSNALQALRDGRARVCIATDVAARGLDLDNLGLVIHADLPRDPATLLHRSGRTGRAGRKGVSALIVAPKARRRVERLLNDAKIEANWGTPPSADEINALDDARLLADPSLTRPIHESERAMIDALISQHGAEQVAAAFLRKQREGRSAPEDLREVDVTPPKPRRERGEQGDWTERAPREKRGKAERKGFDDAVWVRLNVGRKKNAEARWILPVLCKAGGLSRDDIGAIRINPGDTHVELTSEAAARFFEALGHGATLEKGLRAEPLEGAPEPWRRDAEDDRPAYESRKPRARREDRAPRDDAGDHGDRPAPYVRRKAYDPDAPRDVSGKKPWKKKTFQDEAAPAAREPSPRTDYIQDDRKKPYKDKPKGDFQRDDRGGDKPAGKPHGKPYAKAGGKPGKPRTEGGWKPPVKAAGKRQKPGAAGGKPAFQKGGKPPKKHRKPGPNA